MAGKENHRGFGFIRKLPSKRYQASYVGPDTLRHTAARTFDTRLDAEGWLTTESRLISADAWTSPKARATAKTVGRFTFGEYADTWLTERDLRPRTHELYRNILTRQIRPTFGDIALRDITSEAVRKWYSTTATTTPTARAHAYSLLRTILNQAVLDEVIPTNPCRIRGAGQTKRVRKIEPASLPELEALVAAMPDRYQLMTLLASWCGLRFGELTELRRKDVDTRNGVLRVRRGVVRIEGEAIVGEPKSEAGRRDVAIPPHLVPMVKAHVAAQITGGREGLLFTSPTGNQITPTTLYRAFYPARGAAGRPDLRWHDLRHTGAVLAASTGATLAELMARLGHSTPAAALRYQHAAQGRDQIIAKALSDLVNGTQS